jgi:D-alanine-D-alanine ligase
MKAGITYDLRADYLAEGYTPLETAEFDKPDTIEAIEDALKARGYETERIGHVRRLVSRLSEGGRWDIVFNIAEGLTGLGREAQVPALLDAYGIPYTFSDPMVLSLTLHKGMTKRVIRDLGLPTPAFRVVETRADISNIDLPYPLFVKPVSEGTGKGVTAASKVKNKAALEDVCLSLLARFNQSVLVETFLPGREFTVGIVGTGADAAALGAMEVVFKTGAEADSYSYFNKENYEELVEYRLVDDREAVVAAEVALAAWRGLGCRDGGRVDLRSDAFGSPNFIEVNPLAGLNPIHSDLPILCRLAGISYGELISDIMQSAEKRLKIHDRTFLSDAKEKCQKKAIT